MKDLKDFISKNLKWIMLVLVSLGALALLSFFVYVAATQENLTSLESVLLQFISLAIGCGVSFFVGRRSVSDAAKEIIKPHARKAFRRLVSLYRSLSRAANAIKSAQDNESPENQRVTLAKLDAIVTEQLATADDALEDWNDIVPEDVEELKQKLQSDDTTGDIK